MIATRTFSPARALPFEEPFEEAIVSFLASSNCSESVSTISWLVVRLRSRPRRVSFSFSSGGMRRRTSPCARGGAARRPLASKGTAKREARMPTATSLRFDPVASTSRSSRRLSAAGMRTSTSLRSRAMSGHTDSTNLLSAVAELAPNREDALDDREPRRRGQDGHDAGQHELVERGEDESRRDYDDALGAAADANVAAQAEDLGLRARVADQEGAGDGGE